MRACVLKKGFGILLQFQFILVCLTLCTKTTIYFVASMNDIALIISFLANMKLVNRKITDFCILIFSSTTLPNLLNPESFSEVFQFSSI